MLVCRDLEDARTTLDTRQPERIRSATSEASERPLVFMFSGQGSQYVNMGRQLYELEPVFREKFDECHELLDAHVDFSLRDLLYPPRDKTDEAAQKLVHTAVTQPAIFAFEYALANFWISCGIYPLGNGRSQHRRIRRRLPCRCVLTQGCAEARRVARPAHGQLPTGSMLAVPLSETDVQPYLKPPVALAAVNAPSLCVLSGPADAIETICRPPGRTRHPGSSAAHFACIPFAHDGPGGGPVRAGHAAHHAEPPQIPYLSNLTGTWITPEEATSPGLLGQASAPYRAILRGGTGAVTRTARGSSRSRCGTRLDDDGEDAGRQRSGQGHPLLGQDRAAIRFDYDHFLDALGQLWLNGIDPQWTGPARRRARGRVSAAHLSVREAALLDRPTGAWIGRLAPGRPLDVSDWFYVPSWKPAATNAASREMSRAVARVLQRRCDRARASCEGSRRRARRSTLRRLAQQWRNDGVGVRAATGGSVRLRRADRRVARRGARPDPDPPPLERRKRRGERFALRAIRAGAGTRLSEPHVARTGAREAQRYRADESRHGDDRLATRARRRVDRTGESDASRRG